MKFHKILTACAAFLLVLCMLICSACSEQNKNNISSASQLETTNASTTVQPTTLSAEEIEDNKLDDIISQMSIEEKVGQMFYVRCPDTDAVTSVSEYHIGGYILFGRDFENKTKDEITANISSYQAEAEIPLIIGTDEEGGTVVRVSDNPALCDTPFLSPSDTFALGGWDAIEDDSAKKADLLLSLGVNVNMAPVCDITSDPNAFMYYRSFSGNTDNVCKFVETVVEISKDKKLGTVMKHFPGYGNNDDTHTGIAYDNREYSDFENNDFKPFEAGIKAGGDCILVSHNIVSSMDSEYPASLSSKVHRIIREELNFDGVVMTDDLSMEAITQYTGSSSAAVLAVQSGNDMLCCTDFQVQYPAVLEAVKSGEISESRINDSAKRILRWKYNLGLISD